MQMWNAGMTLETWWTGWWKFRKLAIYVFTYSQCQQNTWRRSLSLGIFYTSCPKEMVMACRICIWTRAPKDGYAAGRRSTVTLGLWQTLWSLFLTIMPERWHIYACLVQHLIINTGHWFRVMFFHRLKALDICSIMTSLQRVTLPLHLATVKVIAAVFHLIASQTSRCNKTLNVFFLPKGVVMLDRQTGVWLSHSTPKFPKDHRTLWPDSANNNAQTFMCVTYSYDTFNEIGKSLPGILPFVDWSKLFAK